MRLTSLRGRRVVVTGASSGIGRALAVRMGREGARLALTARRRDALEQVAAAVEAAGGEARVLPCDVAERDAVFAAAAELEAAWGGVDVLVNNAGYGHHRPFLDWDVEDMERMMRVNYLGSLYWTKALLPGMAGRREGWIVFVASVAGHLASPDESAYAASKFAMVALAESLSMEVQDAGVHVLTVCPGVIDTPFFDEEALARMPRAALRQMVQPEGLADAVVGALARGRHRLTYPRLLAAAYPIREACFRFFRWGARRTALPRDGAQ